MPAVSESQRIEPRTNMFVLATISWAGASGPVKIRNMSASGALIEGTVLPPVGETVLLRRGSSVAAGKIAWCKGGKAGVKLDQKVAVSEWMPGDSTGQTRVDQIVHRIRSEKPTAEHLPVTSAPLISSSELRTLADGLCSLADDLADDMDFVIRHSSRLQLLDIAAQTLRKVAASR